MNSEMPFWLQARALARSALWVMIFGVIAAFSGHIGPATWYVIGGFAAFGSLYTLQHAIVRLTGRPDATPRKVVMTMLLRLPVLGVVVWFASRQPWPEAAAFAVGLGMAPIHLMWYGLRRSHETPTERER